MQQLAIKRLITIYVFILMVDPEEKYACAL